tara:strand:+ start:1631 stop:2182 length:552 start_codon:yes stop_codon:yes gene_type:complete
MEVRQTNIPGVLIIKPKVHIDSRGLFTETFSSKRYEEAGIDYVFVQDNLSHSTKNVIRGLHYQIKKPQGKLVRVTRGRVFDVALDIRLNSPTFGSYFSTVIDDSDFCQIFLPPGIAHGFCVLSDCADFQYKCTDYYVTGDEGGVLWNDLDLNIDWPLKDPIVSKQDQKLRKLADIPKNLLPKF